MRAAVYSKTVSQSCEHLNRPQSTSDHSSGGLSEHSCCGAGGPRVVPHVPHLSPHLSHHLSPSHHSNNITDIASVIYQPNILGIAGPRYVSQGYCQVCYDSDDDYYIYMDDARCPRPLCLMINPPDCLLVKYIQAEYPSHQKLLAEIVFC